jgi:hypothetical protein
MKREQNPPFRNELSIGGTPKLHEPISESQQNWSNTNALYADVQSVLKRRRFYRSAFSMPSLYCTLYWVFGK